MERLKNLFSTRLIRCSAFCFGLLFSIFSVCAFSSSSASALVIQDASAVVLLNGAIATNHGSVTGTISGSDLVFTIPNTDTLVNGLWFKFNTTSGTSPNYLMTFNVRYQAVSGQSGYLQLDGLLGDNMDVITTSCVNTHNNAAFDGSVTVYQGSQTVTCTYLVLSHGNYDEFQSRQNSRIANFYQQVVGSSKIVLTPGTLRHFSTDGLTQSDRDWLESVLQGNATDVSSVISKLNEVKSEQQATTRAIQAQTEQQHDDYESEVEREEAKQEELEDQADDLSLSASSTGNPFANMFNASGCVNMPIVGGWFGNPNLKVCSPYPATIANILNFVGSAIIVGFLIRIYYKHMNGGYQS